MRGLVSMQVYGRLGEFCKNRRTKVAQELIMPAERESSILQKPYLLQAGCVVGVPKRKGHM